jgi:hypothetical protein
MAAGWHGIRTVSGQTNGANLVPWRWNGRGEPIVRQLDPFGDLPENQTSWPR